METTKQLQPITDGAISDSLDLEFKTPDELFKSYMPFINGGGLFIPCTDEFSAGCWLTLQLRLPGDITFTQVFGKVVWITPAYAQNQKVQGVGIQLPADAAALNKRIKVLLEGFDLTHCPTYTF
ncbi:PilZ domain-containing protein [Oceanospirillum sediminis]|uniref:PilZ domain-containing protein n=1 Tax=Oceanospirillum sediminis TaxID=2760088 RepID=A0A839ITK7_9GAMM|nr:PilZ domain-containing protein [Oceanospirillum sediminis]MBB1487466.1 PilZ domain-containing protein [Oceanospirillum sediminis]